MGFDEGILSLNGGIDTFFPGQIISGRLEFDQDKVKNFRGIYLEVKGFCKVHWTTSHTRRVNDRTEHYTVNHDSYEEYLNATIYLVGGKHGEHQLNPGHHVFPFEYRIPPDCPSSYEGNDGHVRYKIKAVVDRPFKFDQTKKITFRVNAPFDLNTNPYCKEPIEMEFHQSYCCWCMSAGNSEVLVKVAAGGWCPGQVVPVEVAVTNTSTVELVNIRFQIKKKVTFHAQHEPDRREYTDTVLEVRKGPVSAGTTRNWTVDMALPDMEVPNLDRCRFIDLDHSFKVKIETSGCHEDDESERPLFIGTIPLSTNYHPPIPAENPTFTPGVTTYPQQPIITQPFPTVTPYPNNAPPIGINPPDNPHNSPFPNMTPYPTGPNSPYPPPYPGNNAPYPPSQGNNPPYPMSQGTNGHYPATNITPYPAQNPNISPYPAEPGQNSPFPGPQSASNAPYPLSPNSGPNIPFSTSSPNVPYPNTNAPYPPGVNHPQPNTNVSFGTANPSLPQSGLKTGTLGFIGGKEGSNMPLLPQGGSPYPATPYSAASAPTQSTPEAKQFSGDIPNDNPPFNPDFKS